MYTTEQFEKEVAGLRALIKMCDDLEKENDKKTNALIDQISQTLNILVKLFGGVHKELLWWLYIHYKG